MATQLITKAQTIPSHFNFQQWGMYGFVFFFLKGMFWLIAPLLFYGLQ